MPTTDSDSGGSWWNTDLTEKEKAMQVLEDQEKTEGTPSTTAINVSSPTAAVEVDTEYDLEAAPLPASAAFVPSTKLSAASKSKPSLKPKPRFGNRFSKKKKKATAPAASLRAPASKVPTASPNNPLSFQVKFGRKPPPTDESEAGKPLKPIKRPPRDQQPQGFAVKKWALPPSPATPSGSPTRRWRKGDKGGDQPSFALVKKKTKADSSRAEKQRAMKIRQAAQVAAKRAADRSANDEDERVKRAADRLAFQAEQQQKETQEFLSMEAAEADRVAAEAGAARRAQIEARKKELLEAAEAAAARKRAAAKAAEQRRRDAAAQAVREAKMRAQIEANRVLAEAEAEKAAKEVEANIRRISEEADALRIADEEINKQRIAAEMEANKRRMEEEAAQRRRNEELHGQALAAITEEDETEAVARRESKMQALISGQAGTSPVPGEEEETFGFPDSDSENEEDIFMGFSDETEDTAEGAFSTEETLMRDGTLDTPEAYAAEKKQATLSRRNRKEVARADRAAEKAKAKHLKEMRKQRGKLTEQHEVTFGDFSDTGSPEQFRGRVSQSPTPK